MKILMVCLGNICRSPMAEGQMRAKIEKYKLNAEVDSAGFEAFHSGDEPDSRAIRVMKKHGIDISGQQSRIFRKSDFDVFDRIYVMDSGNYRDVKSVAQKPEQMRKVDCILNIIHPGRDNPVPDPYYGGNDGFETTYHLLDEATEKIALELMKGGK
jgi:protein-tyrosine phosphatase